jgi:hypothetical protein
MKCLMKRISPSITYLLFFTLFFSSCGPLSNMEKKAKKLNQIEMRALILAKKNRELEFELSKEKYKIKNLEAENAYLKINKKQEFEEKIVDHQNEKKIEHRVIRMPTKHIVVMKKDLNHGHEKDQRAGSRIVKPVLHGSAVEKEIKKDFIHEEIYQWSPEQMILMAEKHFQNKNYISAAESYYTLLNRYGESTLINDEILFMAGLSSYKSEKHLRWSVSFFKNLLTRFPDSQYLRSSKVWLALASYRLGDKKMIQDTLKEFESKYRNTQEWEVLSSYYENFVHQNKTK